MVQQQHVTGRAATMTIVAMGLGYSITAADPTTLSANLAEVRRGLEFTPATASFLASLCTLTLAAAVLGAIHTALDERRAVGATAMNEHSSRSHCIVRLDLESFPKEGGGQDTASGAAARLRDLDPGPTGVLRNPSTPLGPGVAARVSHLNLVDLAGARSRHGSAAKRPAGRPGGAPSRSGSGRGPAGVALCAVEEPGRRWGARSRRRSVRKSPTVRVQWTAS